MFKTQKGKAGKKKTDIFDTVSGLYNDLLETYFDEFNNLADAKKVIVNIEYYKERSFDEKELDDLSPLEGDKEVKEGNWLKILAPNKLLTRLQILLAQIKDGNNSNKLKNEIRQILYLLYHQIILQKNNQAIIIM